MFFLSCFVNCCVCVCVCVCERALCVHVVDVCVCVCACTCFCACAYISGGSVVQIITWVGNSSRQFSICDLFMIQMEHGTGRWWSLLKAAIYSVLWIEHLYIACMYWAQMSASHRGMGWQAVLSIQSKVKYWGHCPAIVCHSECERIFGLLHIIAIFANESEDCTVYMYCWQHSCGHLANAQYHTAATCAVWKTGRKTATCKEGWINDKGHNELGPWLKRGRI